MRKRLFIVSNRLPVTIGISDDQINVNESSGGLVTAISGFLRKNSLVDNSEQPETFWVGVPGCGTAIWGKASNMLPKTDFTYLPVFMNKKLYEHYYNGFSNSVIWPLFHYFPSFVEYSETHFERYMEANASFLNIILENAQPTDTIWIHDYHLLPLAGMIREQIPGISIGFFLHIPFPSYEIFRIIPKEWQEKIMLGLLGADLIGFHTIDYASHFLTSAQMILGMDNEMHILRHADRLIKVDVFPISIDYDKFFNAYDNNEVALRRDNLKSRFEDIKIIFSVDRLDYTKGVYNRLKAFELFLKQNPEYIEKVIFVMVIVPSRDGISKYAESKKRIDEFIGNLNSSLGTIHWQPIIYQYNTLDFTELLAMYTSCDLALITPLRDGMNLVSKEFVASRKDLKGVLVLSDMAGAARELTDALIINPNDIYDMARKIKKGLEMNPESQKCYLENMQKRIKNYDVNAWATDFLTQLDWIKEKQKEFEIKLIDPETKYNILEQYNNAEKRLFLLDYDGTLVSFASSPGGAVPGRRLLDMLSALTDNKNNTVYVISGRNSATLDKWLGHLPINLIAEHGAKFKPLNGSWEFTIENPSMWLENIAAIMELYVKRCANSLIEVKESSIAWHFRNVNPEQGKLRAAELYLQLSGFTNNLGLQVLMGNKVIEVRHNGVNKGNAVRKILKKNPFDFIYCCGDDTTDEDMFRELANVENAVTVKIGPAASFAKFNLPTSEHNLSLLQTLAETNIAAITA